MKVLVVDDNEDIRDIVELVGQGMDVDATYCKSSLDALKFLTDNKVDFAIIDLKMPYMDGMRLVKEAKKNQPYPTHYICYTGIPLDDAIVKMATDAGFERFFAKPCHLADVLNDMFTNREVHYGTSKA